MNPENLVNTAYIRVQFDDIEEFKKLVPSQVDPNSSNYSSQDHLHTFLQCAAAYGAEKCTEYLLNLNNEEEEEQNENNNKTPKNKAKSDKKSKDDDKKLPNRKIIVDATKKNFSGFTALHWAAFSGRTETVRLLVEKGGADLNSRNEDGLTPVHIAASRGHLQFIKFLVENFSTGVDLNAVSSDGWTAVHYALIGNHQPVVKYLIDEMSVDCSGLDVNMKSIQDLADEYGRNWFKMPSKEE